MGKYSIEANTLTAIADAIREKGGTTDAIFAEGMAAAIAAIEAGGGANVSDFGFTKAVFGTTIGSQSFYHGMGEYPKLVVFYADDLSSIAAESSPQFFIKSGVSAVIDVGNGETMLVSGFSTGDVAKKYSYSEPETSTRVDMSTIYYPQNSKPGVCLTPLNPTDKNNVRVLGKNAAGFDVGLQESTLYYWGVLA